MISKNVKFTRASKLDTNIVTLATSQVMGFFNTHDKGLMVNENEMMLVTIREKRTDFKIFFQVNREGSTAATRSWPRALKSPKVGKDKSVTYRVTSVVGLLVWTRKTEEPESPADPAWPARKMCTGDIFKTL